MHYPGQYEADDDPLLSFSGTWNNVDCTGVCGNGMAVESDDGSVILLWYGDGLTLDFLTGADPLTGEVCTDGVCVTLLLSLYPQPLYTYPTVIPVGYHRTVIRALEGSLALDRFIVSDGSRESPVPTWTPAPAASPVAWDLVVTVDPDGDGTGVSVRVPLEIGAGEWVQIALQTLTTVFVVSLLFVAMTRRAGN